MTQFMADLDNERLKASVEADKKEGALLGVSGTPTFFINGEPLVGAPPVERFKALIEAELKSPSGAGKAAAVLIPPNKTASAATGQVPLSTKEQMPVADIKASGKMTNIESPTKGPATAPITMVWYSDFQSPLSPKAYELVSQVMSAYPGKIRLVFKNSPLEFHPEAMLAHEAAMAAAAQGKFWEMHDVVLAHPSNMKREDLVAYGKKVGLDIGQLSKALDLHSYRPKIEDRPCGYCSSAS